MIMNHPFVRCRHVVSRRVDQDVFLVDEETTAIHQLNAVGAAIWEMLEEPRKLSEILDILHTAFPDKSKKTIKKDVKALLEDFLDEELIEELDPDNPLKGVS